MTTTLQDLGWRHFFAQQLSLDDYETLTPARVMSVERAALALATEQSELSLELAPAWAQLDVLARPTVGDWVLLEADPENPGAQRVERLLERETEIKRRAAGAHVAEQLIAANVDTLMIVSSCNQDFNLSRFERYLALAGQSMIEALVVLTKADLAEDAQSYVAQVQSIGSQINVLALNALEPESVTALEPWCRRGQTLALVGSSGVGKSTLINTLLGTQIQETGAVRADDSKGRHTTTRRSLFLTPDRGLVLDSPGMRELQLTDVADGLAEVFADIEELALQCKFKDCQHETEPHCAVRAAIENGELDERRLHNYRKLLREDAYNTMTVAERRAAGRQFNKTVRSALAQKADFEKGKKY